MNLLNSTLIRTVLSFALISFMLGACASPPPKQNPPPKKQPKKEPPKKEPKKEAKKEEPPKVKKREAKIDLGKQDEAVIAELNRKLEDLVIPGFHPWKSSLNSAQIQAMRTEYFSIIKFSVNKMPAGYVVEITGHCNPNKSRPESYFKSLSLQRARGVYNYLVRRGVKGSKFRVRGAGTSHTLDSEHYSKTKNRRVTFKIVKK